MEQINIALDIYSIVICAIIGAYLLSRGMTEEQDKYFFRICVFTLLFILGDLTDWTCQGLEKAWYPAVLQAGQFLYYAVLAPMIFCFCQYICTYLSGRTAISKKYSRIIGVLCIFHLAGAVLTPFTGMYYVITETNEYIRGDLVVLSVVLPMTMYIITLVMAIRYRKAMQKRVIVALLSYSFLPMFGQLVQNAFRGVGALIPGITLAILLVFITIQLDRDVESEKRKRELSEAQTTIMLSQIQPHFLYNVLTIIRRLCDKDPQGAKECINAFSVFLRANMESLSAKLPLPFERELEHVRNYLELERWRFGELLKVVYDIETVDFCLPALSLQPIVENAVRHGICKNETGGTVTIRTVEKEQDFCVIVEDDGPGVFPEHRVDDSPHIGIQNVRMRLAVLCRGSLRIESRLGSGTKVILEIPKEGGRA